MCSNLLGNVVGGSLSKLPHSHGLVSAYGEDCGAVGGEAGVEDGRIVFVVDCVKELKRDERREENV